MADSFFGFNTTLPDDDGGGPLEEISEDEYDALNDETFGAARDDDWEGVHENLVKLENSNSKTRNGHRKDDDEDLDFNFAKFNLDDFDCSVDDTVDAKIQMDPSVWASSGAVEKSIFDQIPKPLAPSMKMMGNNHNQPTQIQGFFTHAAPPPMQQQQQQHQQSGTTGNSINILAQLMKQAASQVPMKICTVEELERNMLNQQTKQTKVHHKTPSSPEKQPKQTVDSHNIRMLGPPPGMAGPPMFNSALLNQINNQQQMQPPPPPQMGGPPFNPAMMQQRPRNMPFPIPPGHSMGNFPQMGPLPFGPPLRGHPPPGHPLMNVPQRQMPPPFPPLQNHLQQQQQQPTNVNQFNQRLVEEIQQNHPMLQSFNRPQHHALRRPSNNHLNQLNPQMQQQQQQQQQHQSNGNYKAEPQDPFANLMSNRDKQWLISIQLMQLHTDTPYFDDYYFTVFKERKARVESRAHISNTMNHPFTQGPKGHAHNMLLVSLSNKNGFNHNNKNQRERKNSETAEGGVKEQTRTHYTPLQFENSLGKLQVGCGSVTAPRKIIDMEVVSSDPATQSVSETTIQRKTARQILLHIETLFKILLKLEDLENPMAIAAAQIIKQKRAKEIQQAVDQMAIARALAGDTTSPEDVKVSVPTDKYPEPETYEELVPKLVACLVPEKVVAMMTVRKGRMLLRRCMPFLKKNPIRWSVWCSIMSSLYLVFKKEKEIDTALMGIYEEFDKQLGYAKLEEVVQITQSLAAEKKTNALLSNKYTLSIIVALILHAEQLFCNADYKRTTKDEESWQQFLKTLANAADGIKNVNSNGPAIGPMDSQVLKTMIQHLTRFNSVQTKPLLNLLTQADSK